MLITSLISIVFEATSSKTVADEESQISETSSVGLTGVISPFGKVSITVSRRRFGNH